MAVYYAVYYVRKGITATSLTFDYNGKKEFVIDMACFPGSSGLPVFLERDGFTREDSKNGIVFKTIHLYSFLGLLYAGPQTTANGEIKTVDIPTSTKDISETKLMMNLEYVIKSQRIMELINLVEAMEYQTAN